MANAAITIDLNAKIANFETELKRATSSLDRFEKKGNLAAAGFKAALGSLGAAVSVGALAAFAKSGIDAADSLNDMSARLGVSVKDLASFKLAAEQSGTSLDGVGTGIARLTRSIGDAEGGNKNLAKSLQALGITARDPKEAFFQLADAVQRIEDPNKRAALLSDVLGKSYGELVPLLNQGSQALRDSAAESETFAEQMAKLAPDADKFNDQLASLKINAAGAAAGLLNELVPALNRVFERFEKLSRLRSAGASLFEIVTGGVSADTKSSLAGVNREIAGLESTIKRLRENSGGRDQSIPTLIANLERLKKVRAELQAQAAGDINRPPPSAANAPGARSGGAAGTTDFSSAFKASGSKSRSRTIDKLDLFNDEMARNASLIAAETERIAGDMAFMADVDIAQNTANFAQEWIEAGRALKEDMKTPLEQFEDRLEYVNELFRRGVIDVETYGRATADAFDKAGTSTAKATEELDTFAKKAAENIQDSFADFLFDPFDKGLDGMLKSFGQTIQRMIADAVAADLTKWLFGDLVKGGSGSGVAGSLLSGIGDLFGFANGGVAAHGRPVPLPQFAGGGIANSAAIFGEAGPEAAVPLPDGRRIPVELRGGGGNVILQQTIQIDARGADSGVEARIRQAAADGARQGYAMVVDDLSRGGPVARLTGAA